MASVDASDAEKPASTKMACAKALTALTPHHCCIVAAVTPIATAHSTCGSRILSHGLPDRDAAMAVSVERTSSSTAAGPPGRMRARIARASSTRPRPSSQRGE